MKKTLKYSTVAFALLFACLTNGLCAQGYVATAQLSYQAVGDGTYNYTILLQNAATSTESLNTFWFAWVPDDYGYDLLSSYPTVTAQPDGWYASVNYGNYYYPDGYSIDFYNYYGADLAPGGTDTFMFNSPDSPDTLFQNSPYDSIPTLTSYVYGDSGNDPGTRFQVALAPTPEPSTLALFGVAGASLLFAARRRIVLKPKLAVNPSPISAGR